jgi:hypothetical protein
MLERYNPILRIFCIALAGVIVWQISRLAFPRDAVARSRMEMPVIHLDATNKTKLETNAVTSATNSMATKTNAVAGPTNSPTSGATNISRNVAANGPANRARIPGMRGMGPGGPPHVNLPPDVQATVDKIRQSQLLGPDIKPPPMALLGIAGKDVFLRGPNGQTGIIRVGEEVGGAKLLRVGTNRVLVEHEGQQKELMIFEGFGSETLLEKKDKP